LALAAVQLSLPGRRNRFDFRKESPPSPENALDSSHHTPRIPIRKLGTKSARNTDNAKTDVVVPVVRVVVVPNRGTQVLSFIVPRTAPQHPKWHPPYSLPRKNESGKYFFTQLTSKYLNMLHFSKKNSGALRALKCKVQRVQLL
jgi:hypothetical protein